jgi:hypothetical protein
MPDRRPHRHCRPWPLSLIEHREGLRAVGFGCAFKACPLRFLRIKINPWFRYGFEGCVTPLLLLERSLPCSLTNSQTQQQNPYADISPLVGN